jgi:hypothetical protein
MMPKNQATKDPLVKAKAALETFITTKPKASLRSMKEIVSVFNGIPNRIADEEGNLDFDAIANLIAIGVRQIDNTVTADEVESVVNMDNIQEAIQAATNFMTMTVPEGVVPVDAEDKADDQEPAEGTDPLGENEKN